MAAATVTDWSETAANAARAKSSRSIMLYCTIAFAAALYLLPFVRTLSGAPDEGIYLYNAQRVVEGAIPGRDFVQENPPLAYYWLAFFFKLFGTSFFVARMLLLATGVATAVVIFHLARRCGSSGICAALWVLVTSIPLMPINSPHYDSNLFALVGFSFFLIGADRMLSGRNQIWPFIVAGVLEGMTTCILQQKGALLLIGFVVSLAVVQRRNAIRPSLIMTALFGGVLLLEVLPYLYWGAFGDLVLSSFAIPLAGYHALNRCVYGFPLWTVWFPALFTQFRAGLSLALAVPMLVSTSLPFLLMVFFPGVLALIGYVWRSRVFGPKLLPYWITGYALWLSELHRQDLNHLRHGCALFVVLFFILCERYGPKVARYLALTVMIGTLLMGFTTLNGALRAETPIFTRRGLMFGHEPDPVLQFLLAHTRPGDYVFVHPYAPVYYFAADLRNPTRLSTIVDQRKNVFIDEAVRMLEVHQPRYAIEDTKLMGNGFKTMFPAFVPPPPHDRVIDKYLSIHYHQIGMAGQFRILERDSK